jgi:hypothetical protein
MGATEPAAAGGCANSEDPMAQYLNRAVSQWLNRATAQWLFNGKLELYRSRL